MIALKRANSLGLYIYYLTIHDTRIDVSFKDSVGHVYVGSINRQSGLYHVSSNSQWAYVYNTCRVFELYGYTLVFSGYCSSNTVYQIHST